MSYRSWCTDRWEAGFLPGALVCMSLMALCMEGCGYHHWAGPVVPAGTQAESMTVADDGSITFVRDRLEVSLRAVTDAELNRQFGDQSEGGPKASNPYTYGHSEEEDRRSPPQRFSVFRLRVKNYAFPKVRIDPADIVLHTDDGRRYWSLNLRQLETYYRAYAIGYRGNEYRHFQGRVDLLRQTLFKSDEIFSGQEAEGYLVFPVLHHGVTDLTVAVNGAVLRFDYRDQPVETVDISYQFSREIGRVGRDGQVRVRNPSGG